MFNQSLDRQSAVPLYYQIQQRLVEEIRAGRLRPADPIRSEQDIAARLRVSRMTARQALKSLCDLGVAFSRRGKGTFVSGAKLEMNFRHVFSFSEEIRVRGLRPSSRLVHFKVVTANEAAAEALRLSTGEGVISLCRVRFCDSLPMAIELSHLPQRMFPDFLEKFDPNTSLYQALFEEYGIEIEAADEVVEAGLARAKEVELLGIARGSPIFNIKRTAYASGGKPIEYVRSVYRGDRYRLTNHLIRKEAR